MVGGEQHFCEMNGREGEHWSLLMRVRSDASFYYGASIWTSHDTYNADTIRAGPSNAASGAKFAAFASMPFSKLLVENTDTATYTVLQPKHVDDRGHPLLTLMQRETSTELSRLSGVTYPWDLASGSSCGVSPCGAPWSINGGRLARNFDYRIGGTFT